jgi:hypothetical protein
VEVFDPKVRSSFGEALLIGNIFSNQTSVVVYSNLMKCKECNLTVDEDIAAALNLQMLRSLFS